MSVVGIDVGNDALCVALARKRGIDVLLNKESKRETPALVSFGEKMRFLGTDAAGKIMVNPKNTVSQIKRLLGKKFQDPAVQADISKLPYKVFEGSDGGCLIEVMYCNEPVQFTPEQIVAMLLVDQKRVVEGEGIPVTDAVIGVPTYFTEAERYAMLNAASIAGINCLRLINETTATALAYGIYKTDLPETDAIHVAFVDVGHSSTQVSIVAFKRTGFLVKSHAWDRDLGGRDFDEVIFDHFCAEVKAKQKLDIKSNAKASFKLRAACEKVKKMLSANTEAPLNVECLMDDQDVRGSLNRDKFEELAQPLLQRMHAPLSKALADSGLSVDDIASIEVVGSSTRVPALYRIIEDFFKKTPSRTLNAKEVVSRGCALQCAMLSPVFKVREYEVVDAVPYTVVFSWDKDGEAVDQKMFERGSTYPVTKMLTFLRHEPFSISANYQEDASLPSSTDRHIGTFQVGAFAVPTNEAKAKLKVKVRYNLHGLVAVESVQSIEEEEIEEAVPEPSPAEPVPTAMEASEAAGPAPETNGPTPGPAPKTEKKKRVKKVDVKFETMQVAGYSTKQLDDYFEREGQMQAADKLQEETNERKNALEAYIYSLRNRLYGDLAAYVKPGDAEKLTSRLSDMEDWLYDEGEDQTKSVYVAKLDELKKEGDPIEMRYLEDQTRPGAIEDIRKRCEHYLQSAQSDSPQLAHIPPEEREKVVKECLAAIDWLNEKHEMQARLNKYEEPVLLTSDITKKRDVIERVCKPIMTRPPPPPPKVDPPAKEQDKQTPQGPQAMETEGTEQEPMQTDQAGGEVPMQE